LPFFLSQLVLQLAIVDRYKIYLYATKVGLKLRPQQITKRVGRLWGLSSGLPFSSVYCLRIGRLSIGDVTERVPEAPCRLPLAARRLAKAPRGLAMIAGVLTVVAGVLAVAPCRLALIARSLAVGAGRLAKAPGGLGAVCPKIFDIARTERLLGRRLYHPDGECALLQRGRSPVRLIVLRDCAAGANQESKSNSYASCCPSSYVHACLPFAFNPASLMDAAGLMKDWTVKVRRSSSYLLS